MNEGNLAIREALTLETDEQAIEKTGGRREVQQGQAASAATTVRPTTAANKQYKKEQEDAAYVPEGTVQPESQRKTTPPRPSREPPRPTRGPPPQMLTHAEMQTKRQEIEGCFENPYAACTIQRSTMRSMMRLACTIQCAPLLNEARHEEHRNLNANEFSNPKALRSLKTTLAVNLYHSDIACQTPKESARSPELAAPPSTV
eukprot:6477448-Amphidinium_carterae.1